MRVATLFVEDCSDRCSCVADATESLQEEPATLSGGGEAVARLSHSHSAARMTRFKMDAAHANDPVSC
jgi:hypothetical protein